MFPGSHDCDRWLSRCLSRHRRQHISALGVGTVLPTCRDRPSRSEIQRFVAYIVSMPKSARSRKRKPARVLSSRLVYRGPAFWVTSERVEEPSGVRVLREVVRHPGSVVILATDEGGREPLVLLERQYRHAADSYLWELPAGRIDEREQPLGAAKLRSLLGLPDLA